MTPGEIDDEDIFSAWGQTVPVHQVEKRRSVGIPVAVFAPELERAERQLRERLKKHVGPQRKVGGSDTATNDPWSPEYRGCGS